MQKQNEYVVGFLFDEKKEKVALVLKNRPEFQKGKWNGIGGKREAGEYYEMAMVREFEEEAGVCVVGWREFCVLQGDDCEIRCFTMSEDAELKTITDEEVAWHFLNDLPENLMPNLRWLIPLALDQERDPSYTVSQFEK